MKTKVIVKAHPETNQVLTANANKADWSTVRLEQSTPVMRGRILNVDKRVAFVTGPTELFKQLNLTADTEYPVSGKLVVKEALEPFYEGQQPKVASGTTVVCRKDDQPIYREVQFTQDMSEADVFIAHTNSVEIKEAQTVGTALGANQ